MQAWNDSIVEHFCENYSFKALQSTTDPIHFQFETREFCENPVCTILVQMIIFYLIMEMLFLSLVFILREIIWKYSLLTGVENPAMVRNGLVSLNL